MVELMRHSYLRLTIVLWLWTGVQPIVHARNITIQDTDATIIYQPPSSWHAFLPNCSKCLVTSPRDSYHQANDLTYISRRNGPPTSLSIFSSGLPSAFITHPQSDHILSPHDAPLPIPLGATIACDTLQSSESAPCIGSPSRVGSGLEGRGEKGPSTALMSFNFTGMKGVVILRLIIDFVPPGSAVYLFALSAQQRDETTAIKQDVTIHFDDRPTVTTTSKPSNDGYYPFYAVTGLQNTLHRLVISVDHSSVFLFDRLIYTTPQSEDSSSTPPPSQIGTAILVQESPSPTSTS